ncbi:ATP-binding protein [Streptomyces albidus (ex Kaewkla and Franco 2022)]|uniref:ATP-binding protein n=1 Tax=Streptomyces albidus (ex Kaewkla and Franco 2022) TaxID=722709 RepID=UPI0015EEED1D|nr:ATP-binding protein [Streptomyces albidus (ex Kaewkla and Franco 2022)]
MSLPLTRRIAKTVLLTAAGAASVVGTAGAASAAELPSTADVGGLSNLDTAHLGKTVDGASRSASRLAPKSSTSTLENAAPQVEKKVADQGRTVAPRTSKLADAPADDARALPANARSATSNLPQQPQELTTSRLLKSADTAGLTKKLPGKGKLSVAGMPIGG